MTAVTLSSCRVPRGPPARTPGCVGGGGVVPVSREPHSGRVHASVGV